MAKNSLLCCLILLAALIQPALCQDASQSGNKKEQKTWQNVQPADAPPYRVTETETKSNGNAVKVEKLDSISVDGTLQPLRETRTETVAKDAQTNVSTRQEFTRGADGRTNLTSVVREERRTAPDGGVRIESTTSRVDMNGRLQVERSELLETLEKRPDYQRTQTTVFVPDFSGRLAASQVLQGTERRTGNVTEYQETRLLPDGNRGWNVNEQKTRTTRGAAGNLTDEENVYRKNEEGKLSLVERTLGKEWKDAQGAKHRSAETYSRFQGGRYSYADAGLHLDERVHTTEVTLSDGGRKSVQEVERRSYAAPSEPLRVEERTVEVLHPDGKGGLEGTRELQTLDPNGKFVTVRTMQIREEAKNK